MNTSFVVFLQIFLCMILQAKDERISVVETLGGQGNFSKGIVIHKRTSRFIDIEAPVERTWISCYPTSKTEGLLSIQVADADTTYDFGYRRPLLRTQNCKEEEKFYRQMIKGSKTIRLVGMSSEIQEEKNNLSSYPSNKNMPVQFLSKPKYIGLTYIRLQFGDKCTAYFSEHCELPKNYWGSLIPE